MAVTEENDDQHEDDPVERAWSDEAWRIMLEAAQTGALSGSPGVENVRRRFYTQWLQGEGLLTCPECGVEFPTAEEYAEHEKWEC